MSSHSGQRQAAAPQSTRADSGAETAPNYEPPQLVELGNVRDVVLGSSSSGNGDANGQYYW